MEFGRWLSVPRSKYGSFDWCSIAKGYLEGIYLGFVARCLCKHSQGAYTNYRAKSARTCVLGCVLEENTRRSCAFAIHRCGTGTEEENASGAS